MGMFTVPKEEIDRCIQRLNDIKTGSNREVVLKEIGSTILQLQNGKSLYANIQKLVYSNNTDRAIKLLRAAPLWRGGIFRIGRFIGAITIGASVLFGMPFMTRCNGAYEPAMEALNACPQAVELLGSPITQSTVGIACGSSETSGSYGRASWQFSVQGSKGSGSFQFAGRNEGQGWFLDNAILTSGNQTVSVWPCGNVSTQLIGAVVMNGEVVSVQGTAIPVKTSCTITVSPSPPQAVQNGYNCHVQVQCGTAIIYGWEGSGYTQCRVSSGVATRADDTKGAAAGDDPILALDIVNQTCLVRDDGAAPYAVNIVLTPAPAEVPKI